MALSIARPSVLPEIQTETLLEIRSGSAFASFSCSLRLRPVFDSSQRVSLKLRCVNQRGYAWAGRDVLEFNPDLKPLWSRNFLSLRASNFAASSNPIDAEARVDE